MSVKENFALKFTREDASRIRFENARRQEAERKKREEEARKREEERKRREAEVSSTSAKQTGIKRLSGNASETFAKIADGKTSWYEKTDIPETLTKNHFAGTVASVSKNEQAKENQLRQQSEDEKRAEQIRKAQAGELSDSIMRVESDDDLMDSSLGALHPELVNAARGFEQLQQPAWDEYIALMGAIQNGETPDRSSVRNPILRYWFDQKTTPHGAYSVGVENLEDFTELSQPVRLEAADVEKKPVVSMSPTMTKEMAMRAIRMTNQIDPLYDYINNIDGYRDLNANRVQTEFARYDHLEESERKIYTYLYRSQGKELAEAYLNTLANTLTDRMAAANAEVIRQNIEDMPWLAPVYAIGSTPANLLGGVVGAVDMLWQTVTNGEVDINSDAQRFARYGRTVRSIATEDMGRWESSLPIRFFLRQKVVWQQFCLAARSLLRQVPERRRHRKRSNAAAALGRPWQPAARRRYLKGCLKN